MLVSRNRLIRRLRRTSDRMLRRAKDRYTPEVYETIRRAHADAFRGTATR